MQILLPFHFAKQIYEGSGHMSFLFEETVSDFRPFFNHTARNCHPVMHLTLFTQGIQYLILSRHAFAFKLTDILHLRQYHPKFIQKNQNV